MSDIVKGTSGRACSKTEVSKDDELKTTRGPAKNKVAQETPMSGA
jgi:hypothetical protein